MALADDILRKARKRGPGCVFTAKDFLDHGSRAAVDQSLVRLNDANKIRRIDRGIYDFPRVHPKIGPLWPSTDSVARAVARQTGSTVVDSGPRAANTLGLSTQVPAQVVYLTDGPSRNVRLGNTDMMLKHAGPVDLLLPGTAAGGTIVALHYLGRRGLSPDMIQHLSNTLDDADKSRLRKVQKRLPGWMSVAVGQVVGA